MNRTRLNHLDVLARRVGPQGVWRYRRQRLARLLLYAGARLGKRATDVALASLALVLLAPVLLLAALLIKLTDRGPVLFWQTRIGRLGKEFAFPKLRSMRVDAEKVRERLTEGNQHGTQSVTFKMKRDPRVTWIGRIIRKLSIDELPQLWCVLRGDMSLVGPRPPIPREVALYTLADRRRLEGVPGLTCIWQVSGRADIPFDRQVEMDLAYLETQSLWTDLRLLAATIPAVLTARGAY